MCMPWPYVNQECLATGRGLLPWEYDHFRDQHPGLEFEHSAIHAVHDEHAEHDQHDEVMEGHFGLVDHVVEISAASEIEDLQTINHQPIVLLDNFVHLMIPDSMTDEQQAYDSFWKECTVLNTAAYTAIFDLDGNRGEKIRPMTDLGLSHRPARLRPGKLHRRVHGFTHA